MLTYNPISKKDALTVAITDHKVIRYYFTRFFRVVNANNKYQDLLIEEIDSDCKHIKWVRHKEFISLDDMAWTILH